MTRDAEIRLREHCADLTANFPGALTRRTPDRRLAVSVKGAESERTALTALVVPQPSRECRRIQIVRLSRVEALYALARYARVTGWCAPEYISQQFTRFGVIALQVPVYQVEIPWGPPFLPALGRELLEQLRGLAQAERAA